MVIGTLFLAPFAAQDVSAFLSSSGNYFYKPLQLSASNAKSVTVKGKSESLAFENLSLPNLLCISQKSGLLKKGHFSCMYQPNFSK